MNDRSDDFVYDMDDDYEETLEEKWISETITRNDLERYKDSILTDRHDYEGDIQVFHRLCHDLFALFCRDTDSEMIHQKNRLVFSNAQVMRRDFTAMYTLVQGMQTALKNVDLIEQFARETPYASDRGSGSLYLQNHERILLLVMNNLFFAHEHMQCTYLQGCVSDPQRVASVDIESVLLKNVVLKATDEPKAHQKLIEFFLDQCRFRQLRKVKSALFAPKYTDDGSYTHCFEYLDDIGSWIYKIVDPRECYAEQWLWFTDKYVNRKQVEEYLENCHDSRLPTCSKCRWMFSFRNGVYDAKNNRFYTYQRENDWPYNTSQIDPYAVSANYLDYNFDYLLYARYLEENPDPIHLPTPNCQLILSSQHFGPEVCRWFYASLGRLVFEVGQLDNWQFFPFIKGVAGTGKSTLLDLISRIYDKLDVGTMMSRGQTNFSIEHLADVFVFFCTEVDRNMTLEPTIWNSMVSGERVGIDRKFKMTVAKTWTSPGVFAGNVFPPWVDNGGNVSRRMLVFLFDEIVKESDPLLPQRCLQELPVFLFKCVSCYQDLLERFKDMNIWDEGVLPQAFHEARAKTMGSTNSMQAFLSDRSICRLGEAYSCTEADFKNRYREYCQREKVQNYVRYSEEQLYKPIWYRNGVSKTEGVSLDDPNIIHGVGLIEDADVV
jgi:phage/plasmid-associated DNA primase